MCTVTYIPTTIEGAFVLTSNRDEEEYRPTLPPAAYQDGNISVAFPKDEEAGGSWIAMNDKGKINCLLNGGFVAHKKEEHHTVSRGIILLEFTKSEFLAHEFFTEKDLHNVEPFTIVALKQLNGKVIDFTEFIWDGNDKHFRHPEKDKAHIWSSVTLYNKEQRRLRKDWLAGFIDEKKGNFTGLKTVSITQVTSKENKLKMSYFDLLKDLKTVLSL